MAKKPCLEFAGDGNEGSNREAWHLTTQCSLPQKRNWIGGGQSVIANPNKSLAYVNNLM
jgi:hypothetical protein